MSDSCSGPIVVDPSAANLAAYLTASYGVTPANLDQGEFAVDYSDFTGPRRMGTGSDCYVSVSEALSDALSRLSVRPPVAESLSNYLTKDEGIEIPWMLDDGDPSTLFDNEFRVSVEGEIETLKKRLEGQGYRPNDVFYGKFLAENLIYFLQDKYHMRYVPRNEGAYTALQALQKGEANCLEYAFILHEVYRMAGINPDFVEIFESEGTGGEPRLHIVLALDCGEAPTTTVLVDPASKWIVYEPSDKIEWMRIPPIVALAYHHVNKAKKGADEMSLNPEDFRRVEGELKKAVSYAPNHWLLHLNLGSFYARNERFDLAVLSYRKAIALNPEEPALYRDLAIIYEVMGDEQTAEAFRLKYDFYSSGPGRSGSSFGR